MKTRTTLRPLCHIPATRRWFCGGHGPWVIGAGGYEGRGDASCSNHPLVADAAFLILSRPLAYVRIGSLAVHMCEVGK